ncbi:MAG: hypothetical protein KY453_02750 [Gemmatimonadetes bacterium]|nr:hypothetical protein [Gemmatimonadota bacterium]
MVIQITRAVDRVVVFDAPAYRRLVGRRHTAKATELFDALGRDERETGIQPIGYSTVLLELLAPLADPEADGYENAKAAAVAAVRHCRIPTKGGGEDVAVWASSGLQLCLSLFHRWPDELLEIDDRVRSLVERLAEEPSEAMLDTFRDDFGVVAERLEAWRDSFAASLKEHMETPLSIETVAEAHVQRAASHVSDDVSEAELRRMVDWFARKFEVAVAMYRQIVEDTREEGGTITSERAAELLWNLQVAFLIGETHKLDGKPAVVVSGDDDIVKAAKASGLGAKVISVLRYDDYRAAVRELD